ncbi:MAG TPA: FGGY-family carbohydrate kinase [Actinopolymorphaceae bacterium]
MGAIAGREFLLGVDAGQTVTKALVVDRAGQEIGGGAARVALSTPRAHWIERDMEEVWQATARAVRAALGEAGIRGEQVAAVGLVGHNDGLHLLDPEGRPIRPAITALDTRAQVIVDEWRRSGLAVALLRRTGQAPFGGTPSVLLRWILEHEPAALERTRWVVFCKDWLRLRLTGEVATDPTEASAGFTAAATQEYDTEALRLCGLADLRDRLPPLRACDAVAGEVTDDGAAATGLRTGTPVVTGAHDVDGGALGAGAVRPGRLGLVAGTFSINQIVSDDLHIDPRWQARTFLRPGQRLNMSTSASSASNLDWWRRLLGEATYDDLETEVRRSLAADPDSRIVYHPFLYGAPFGREASAALLGVRGWHTRGDLVRAVYEGVALGHRVHVDALRERFAVTAGVRLFGGAARSPVWSQLFADVLGLELEVPECAETGARGAALLAGLGIGWWAELDDAAATARVARRHVPDEREHTRLQAAYDRFVATARALDPEGWNDSMP